MATTRSDHTSEIRKLSTLLDLSQTLGGTLNLKAAFSRALEILEAHHSMRNGSIYLLDDERGDGQDGKGGSVQLHTRRDGGRMPRDRTNYAAAGLPVKPEGLIGPTLVG